MQAQEAQTNNEESKVESQVEQPKEESKVESQVEQPKEEKKESLVSVAPRHIGKAKIKKGPSYDDLQKAPT